MFAFLYKSDLRFVIFWQKNFTTKAALKMLLKLTPQLGHAFATSIIFLIDRFVLVSGVSLLRACQPSLALWSCIQK